jgi:hypothetical protein
MTRRDEMLEALDQLKMLTDAGMFENKEAPFSRGKVAPDPDTGGSFGNTEGFDGDEAERAAEITEIANRLKDLNMLIDASLRDKYKRTGREGGNTVSSDIRICAEQMWEITERVDVKGKLVKTYMRKKMTVDQAIYAIEEMCEFRLKYAAEQSSHKKSFGDDISDRIDEAFEIVRDFLTRNESEKRKAERLEAEERRRHEEAKRREKMRDEEAKRAADAAKKRAEDEKAEELRRQRIAEYALAEAADVAVSDTLWEARRKLAGELGKMRKTYERFVSRFGEDTANYFTPMNSPKYVHDGVILGGLNGLSEYMARRSSSKTQETFSKRQDTFRCCEFLRNCTKYLACDGRYKRAGRLSKDDRFAGIYKGKYEFRRSWVALLRQIVQYVEMLYEDEVDDNKKLYLNRQTLASMHSWGESFWADYAWSTIKQHITTAEEAIKKEPEPKKTAWERLKNSVSRTGEEQHIGDVPELLARLQELGWCADEDLKTEV